ncbi:MAG TPA: hypothetical protein VEQ84_06960 [Vicinamibacteria bacterium]|nr:hypothetical protein [Vicinamibacteria bacterium]
MRTRPISVAALLVTLVLPAAARAAELDPHLAPLRLLVGKTWRGIFPKSTPEKPVVDVSRFEAALNGQAVRNLHSINDGEYGGETLMVWDKEKQAIGYYYFTTAGFYTTGIIQPESDGFTSHEIVKGDANGVTAVKATSRVRPDGRLHAHTEYLKQGKWVEGRDIDYVEAPDARVKFRE